MSIISRQIPSGETNNFEFSLIVDLSSPRLYRAIFTPPNGFLDRENAKHYLNNQGFLMFPKRLQFVSIGCDRIKPHPSTKSFVLRWESETWSIFRPFSDEKWNQGDVYGRQETHCYTAVFFYSIAKGRPTLGNSHAFRTLASEIAFQHRSRILTLWSWSMSIPPPIDTGCVISVLASDST
jgi:hypothetical protein